MTRRISLTRLSDTLMDHYFFALLILAQAALAQLGVPNPLSTGLIGVLLCIAGLGLRRSARIDLWIAVPMAAYLVIGLASNYAVYGDTVRSFPPTHVILLTVYLLMGCLNRGELRLLKRLNALWAAAAAAISFLMFLLAALRGTAGRLSGLLGNPNAMGAFLVVGWFAVGACLETAGEEERGDWMDRILRHAEPVILTALALTLSMGSFLALAVGTGFLLLERKRSGGWGEVFAEACRILAKDTVCFAAGILMYFTARLTCAPWLALVQAAWLLALAAWWELFDGFLRAYPWTAKALTAGGFLVAGAAVAVRPSAFATFTERIAMMKNGMGYLLFHPLLGLGPGQWREWNLYDGDLYFGTWHIHNFLIHIGAELGLIALAMMVLIILRHFRKTGAPAAAAFVFHNLMDTSFFYLGITSLLIISAGEPQKGGKELGRRATGAALVLMALHFAWCIWRFCSLYRFQLP